MFLRMSCATKLGEVPAYGYLSVTLADDAKEGVCDRSSSQWFDG